jgi:hypothetical protein
MIDLWNFDDIRPYNDSEVPGVISRLLDEPRLYEMMAWIYRDLSEDDVREMLSDIKTVNDFQTTISGPAFKVITQMTTSGLTFTNMNRIEHGQAYLFLSNHRDIVLDSALLNVSLMEKDYPTTQIAIGNNLLANPLIHDLVRLNRNFIVYRDFPPRELLMQSQRLSNYIRKTLVDENTSIWIAHKEGRSKDGDDRTAAGLLKMLSLSSDKNVEQSLKELRIVPMAVSYEYDPCDLFKVNELLAKKQNGVYEKSENEDYKSMMKGITGHKGRVNIAVGPELHEIYKEVAGISNKNEKIKRITERVDERLHAIYRLWPTNYIAYDLLHGERKYKEFYTPIQKITFGNYLRGRTLKLMVARKKLGHKREGFMKEVWETFLSMYAMPVQNKEKVPHMVED